LKPHSHIVKVEDPILLSEQHPREQGLKHLKNPRAIAAIKAFRATSKRTRIETSQRRSYTPAPIPLSEQHPREQGLKQFNFVTHTPATSCFQSNIQENKD